METLKTRLSDLLLRLSISQAKFAKSLNVSPSSVSEWLKKDEINPSQEALARISQTYNVNLNWLLTGQGTIYNAPAPVSKDDFLLVPVIESISAGTPLEVSDHFEPLEHIIIKPGLNLNQSDYLCFRVDGDSMFPEIRHNDYVLIQRLEDYSDVDGSIVAVQLDGANTLKAIHLDCEHRQTLLYPINRRHHPIILDKHTPGNIKILGIMVMLYRKYV